MTGIRGGLAGINHRAFGDFVTRFVCLCVCVCVDGMDFYGNDRLCINR